MMVANRNAPGAPAPWPYPTTIGVLKSMAEIGAAPVTVRNSTPPSPTACLRSLATSSRSETSKSSGRLDGVGLDPASTEKFSAMVPPRDGVRSVAPGPAALPIGLAGALWRTSQRGQYHLVEDVTIVLV